MGKRFIEPCILDFKVNKLSNWYIAVPAIALIILLVLSISFGNASVGSKETPTVPPINIELECAFIKRLLTIEMLLKEIEKRNPEWFKERQKKDGQE